MKTIKRLIYQKLNALVLGQTDISTNEKFNFLGSLIIVLSGLVLYADKALVNIDLTPIMPHKFIKANIDADTFVWLVGQTISPLLIMLGSFLRPYFYAYAVPIYCYTLQAYFILIDYSLVDDGYSYAYSFGISIILLFIMGWAKNASQRKTRLMIEQAKARIKEHKTEHSVE